MLSRRVDRFGPLGIIPSVFGRDPGWDVDRHSGSPIQHRRLVSRRELERMNSFRDNPALPPIALVGPGRMGNALARAARAAGIEATLTGRDELDRIAGAEVVLLCVPDAEIENAVENVMGVTPPIRFLGHTSGATGLAALGRATDAGVATFSLHPLQTVPDGETNLTGAPAAICGSSDEALELTRNLARSLGMEPFDLPDAARAPYHAAASIASNFLVALEESAVELLAAAGIEDGRALLTPLVTSTTANWAARGGDALTGPIARGDERTVAAHAEAIRVLAPELAPLYEALAERTRALARGREEVPA
jgi:predicted short-subunit dehydrogenase-like oxidoreductase (DUF2520 family)